MNPLNRKKWNETYFLSETSKKHLIFPCFEGEITMYFKWSGCLKQQKRKYTYNKTIEDVLKLPKQMSITEQNLMISHKPRNHCQNKWFQGQLALLFLEAAACSGYPGCSVKTSNVLFIIQID